MIPLLLASSGLPESLQNPALNGEQPIHWFGEMVIVLAAVLVLALALVALTYLFFKVKKKTSSKRRRATHSTHHSHSSDGRRRKNPTLAETGGLPPKRTDEASS